jgi:hypothetical protein
MREQHSSARSHRPDDRPRALECPVTIGAAIRGGRSSAPYRGRTIEKSRSSARTRWSGLTIERSSARDASRSDGHRAPECQDHIRAPIGHGSRVLRAQGRRCESRSRVPEPDRPRCKTSNRVPFGHRDTMFIERSSATVASGDHRLRALECSRRMVDPANFAAEPPNPIARDAK